MPPCGTCWCCGTTYPETSLTRLDSHPEVAICGDCAHFLHSRALARGDQSRRGIGRYVRSAISGVRDQVIARQWHRHRWLGPLLLRLNRHLP